MLDDEDDVPQLTAETFAALQEFYKEEEEKQKNLGLALENCLHNNVKFQENWQLSQFWYDETTINTLVQIALKTVGSLGKIALISCPSLFTKIRQQAEADCEITLFEYDQRFAAVGTDYIFYDYKSPLDVPKDRGSYYDLVIADPPFLSEECLEKTARTIKFLVKDKIILCTGAVMLDVVQKLLNLQAAKFEPKHQNNLANAFYCYSNYNVDSVI